MPVHSVLLVVHVECPQSEVPHALHDILFDSPCRCHNAVYHLVLHQVANSLSDARGNHVRGVPQEDAGPHLLSILGIAGLLVIPLVERLVRESPVNHLV